jgi:hypothetical protein
MSAHEETDRHHSYLRVRQSLFGRRSQRHVILRTVRTRVNTARDRDDTHARTRTHERSAGDMGRGELGLYTHTHTRAHVNCDHTCRRDTLTAIVAGADDTDVACKRAITTRATRAKCASQRALWRRHPRTCR